MKFGYTTIYVADVPATVAFYEAAFGIHCRFLHESNRYAEMETGDTVLAFAGNEAARLWDLAVQPNEKDSLPAAWELCFVADDIEGAYERSIDNGCTPVSPPTLKPWGQKMSYVRDLNGCLVKTVTPATQET